MTDKPALTDKQLIAQLQTENCRLRDELSTLKSSDHTDIGMLREISSAIVSELSLPHILELVAEKAREIVSADTMLIPMISKNRQEYRYVAASGKNSAAILHTSFAIHVGMCGWVLTHETPLLYGKDAPFALDESTRWEQGQTSALLVPMFGKNRIIGGLSALGKQNGASFTQADQDVITLFANQVSIAIENASLVQELRETLDSLEQRVETRTIELTTMNRELESFCYSASHDLRSPLRGIDGYSQILLDDYPDLADEARHYLQRIRRGSQRMGCIIDDLLSLLQVFRKTMYKQRVDMSAMAAGLLERYQKHTPERNVKVSIAEGLTCYGDPALLEQALDIFIENAWKFTRNSEQPSIEFGQRQDQGDNILFIRDNGCGYNMQYQSKLFKPFQRLHSDEIYAGSGVGLAIAERIINRHGGRIWSISEVGVGSTFMFTLPEHKQ